jgi:hypothetical protein
MPSPAELAFHAALIAFIVGSLRWLRQTQPDPNPAIEAREAAKLATAAIPTSAGGTSTHAAAGQDAERRTQELPYVGVDRRAVELGREAAAWRRSA